MNQIWKPFADLIITLSVSCGILVIVAYLPFPRFARYELEKEFKVHYTAFGFLKLQVISQLQGKVLNLHWYRIKNPHLEQLYRWERQEKGKPVVLILILLRFQICGIWYNDSHCELHTGNSLRWTPLTDQNLYSNPMGGSLERFISLPRCVCQLSI